MAYVTPRPPTHPAPWKPYEWEAGRCDTCGQGGLFLGDSTTCVACEADREVCSCCGKRPRAADLLCTECQADDHFPYERP